MNRTIRTEAAPPSFSAYAQGVEIPAGARTIHVSGQVGARLDGTMEATAEAQHEQAWRNVLAILDAGGMGPEDIVDILALVTDDAGVPLYREVRDRMLGGHLACSTILVCGLAQPDWKVELTVKAARAE